MGENLVNITQDPCKMCLPMGVVTAFYGVARAMSLLHGSQGCSTYIRRHMATHYNEPVDIASSSLSEEGTVFGGEANLIKGLDNLIKLYDPSLIAVATTCLAETIGEDVPNILRKYREKRGDIKARIISVAAPGYGGTHFEGWWKGLYSILSQLPLDQSAHDGINVILGPASPADTRAIKNFLTDSGLDYTLFPDISSNLDGAYNPVYSRLPQEGTSIEKIIKMAGARATIELSAFCPEGDSPGAFLQKAYSVPLIRLAPPVGLLASDEFAEKIASLGGAISKRLKDARGRYMDAMGDSHKYSALGRAAVMGDPDFVLSIAQLNAENGIVTPLCATGSKCKGFSLALREKLVPLSDNIFAGEVKVYDDADYSLIEEKARQLDINLLVGSSEARRMAKRLGVPLVRTTFPIHDHVGGQRVRTFGYSGSIILLDRLVNELISSEEGSFRAKAAASYYYQEAQAQTNGGQKILENPLVHPFVPKIGQNLRAFGVQGADDYKLRQKTLEHPCFTFNAARSYARLHLPIAPLCNIKCNYCAKDSDCPNESRPGLCSKVLSPLEAMEKFRETRKRLPNLKVVGIAGPGESLANPEALFSFLELLECEDKDITLCLSTNGLMLPFFAADLYSLGLRHITVTLNAINPEVGEKIYSYVNFFGETFKGKAAAKLLISNGLSGIKAAKALGMVVKVNCVFLKGINESEIPDLSKKVSEAGADILNIMPLIPVKGTPFESISVPSPKELDQLRWVCGAHLPQMAHCRQCRADAVGLLGDFMEKGKSISPMELSFTSEAKGTMYRIAVVSKSGVMIDSHFGQAERAYIYESDGRGIRLLEHRRILEGVSGCGGPCGRGVKVPGSIQKIVEGIRDCHAVVALRIGESPLEKLRDAGVRPISLHESVDGAVLKAAEILNLEGVKKCPKALGSLEETGPEAVVNEKGA
ncbi:MAG: radical SAM protein [Deltaproteobacteria bacterium]|jgi:nitrogenase molybdenum-iron protein alpha/beta subunit/MoaA/NifB/PqqE/SkfB family radical SAM enzyme|nr:radical SAM protein [Deltaproteobacteria bacterium]